MNSGRFTKGHENPNKILPEIGKRFGELTVISDVIKYNKENRSVWTMECSCGNTQDILAKDLRRSSKPRVKCTSCSVRYAVDKRKSQNGYGNKTKGSHSGIGSFTKTHMHHFKGGVKRGSRMLEWELDIEYLWDLYIKQNKRCKLSSLPLVFGELGDGSSVQFDLMTASLDRIESDLGYVKGNVQWLHKDVNFMKRDHDQEYFIRLCRLISEQDNPEPSLSDKEGATTIPEGSTLK